MGRRSSLLLRGDTASADYHSTTVLSQESGKIIKKNPLSRSPFQPAAIDINSSDSELKVFGKQEGVLLVLPTTMQKVEKELELYRQILEPSK